MKKITKISVKDLINNYYLQGDIKFAFVAANRAVLGIKAHKYLQSNKPSNYVAEYTIKQLFEKENVEIFGRVDGIYLNKNEIIIEEIKSTLKTNLNDINIIMAHLAQAKIYAYLYALQNNIKTIKVRLTYIKIDDYKTKSFDEEYSFKSLKQFFDKLFFTWFAKHNKRLENIENRNKSLVDFDFPFKEYRKGQRQISVKTWHTINNNEINFIQAPCGTGKTAGVIFPALKALGHSKIDRFFYLTAKNSGKIAAIDTLKLMQKADANFMAIEITAKRKICPTPDTLCDSDYCPLAKNYYNKLKDVLNNLQPNTIFDEESIKKIASDNKMCPFELSLDISLLCDVIVIDYNYAFDPQVYLLRFFEENKERYLFLVDETHNLPDRARDMYSCEINKQDIIQLKKVLPKQLKTIKKHLTIINKFLIEKAKECKNNINKEFYDKNKPEDFLKLIKGFTTVCEKYLEKNIESDFRQLLLEFYFNCSSFLKLSDFYGDNYVTIFKNTNALNCIIKMFCLSPAKQLTKSLKKVSSCVFFSATLNPASYFFELILGKVDGNITNISSPFNPKHALYLLYNLNVKYQNRETSAKLVADAVKTAISTKKGNYLVFFPSYAYLKQVSSYFNDDEILIQNSSMSDIEKQNFLSNFLEHSKITAFAVMGGSFSEGIDLLGNKLIGVIVVSVCLPKICLERNLIKTYYDNQKINGFDFAYKYPGFNKVLQAIGRLIRTKIDKGTVILIDERYYSYAWQKLFPEHWENIKKIASANKIKLEFEKFYNC